MARTYRSRLDRLAAGASTFEARLSIFLADRYGAVHFLKPVLDRAPEAFFTNADDETLQRLWAREHGLARTTPLLDILLAQIEHHRSEVFYSLDPTRHDSTFLRRLPGCVRRRIAWQASPHARSDWQGYDLIVNNFPSLLEAFRRRGLPVAWFAPAVDPVMAQYATNKDRSIDVLFAGGFSRHHLRRAEVLEAVARLAPKARIEFHLEASRLTRLAERLPVGGLLARHRRPATVASVAQPAVYGLDLYRALSRARIVLNCAIDMAGEDRGNMRCFEAMGCGALLLSDEGRYPEGMLPDHTMVTWRSPDDACRRAMELLADEPRRQAVARAGAAMLSEAHSKEGQWELFVRLSA
jgi:hypothetical protein